MQSDRRTFIRVLSALAVASFAAVGPLPGFGAAHASAAEALTIAQGNDILSLDPADHGNNSTESALVNLYDYLLQKDFSGDVLVFRPNLATSWSTDDQVHWTIKLRDDVKWHDGKPFTANDVKFTVERTQQDKKLRSASKFKTVKTIKVVDDHTLEIETDGPDPVLLHRFVGNGAGILPKHALEGADKEAFFRNPIGTGPYKFKEWRKADRLILEKNPGWWGGEPKWDSVVVRAIPETSTRVSEFITGGVDIAVNIPPEDIERIKANKGTDVIAFDIARNLALHVRTGEKWATHDPKVREAIDLAIDRDAIVRQVVSGFGAPTRGFYPAKIPGSNPDLSKNLKYDPERARALVKEAGKGEPIVIKFSSPSGRYVKDREISEAIAGYLEDAGFQVQLEVLDWTIYNSRLAGDGFGELYLWGMGSYTDGYVLFEENFKRHYGWSDPEFTRIGEEARSEGNEDKRLALIRQGQKILADQHVKVGILYPQSLYGVNDRVNFSGRFDEMIFAEEVTRK